MSVQRTVLVVDDDPFYHDVMDELLRSLGAFRVISASSASLAMEIIDNGDLPDFLFLDLNMPSTDGIELLTALADKDVGVKVVIVTGAHATVRRAAAELARANGMEVIGAIKKPVTAAMLETVLFQHQGLA